MMQVRLSEKMVEEPGSQSLRPSKPKQIARPNGLQGGVYIPDEPAVVKTTRQWSDVWESLLRMGLGEVTVQAGTVVASITLVLLVLWVMGSFYLKGNIGQRDNT